MQIDWSSMIGLGGLLLGAFTTYLAFLSRKEERTQAYRQALYAQQVTGCEIVHEQIDALLNAIIGLIRCDDADETKLQQLIENAKAKENDYAEMGIKYFLFFPDDVQTELDRFGIEALNCIGAKAAGKLTTTKAIDAAWDKMLMARNRAYESMRELLGVGPLSSETSHILAKNH